MMGELSERVKGLVVRFQVIHFSTNITTIMSAKYKTVFEKKMMKFILAFTTCLAFHLCHETELFINGGIVLPRSVTTISRLTSSTCILNYQEIINSLYKKYYDLVSSLVGEGVHLYSNLNDTLCSVLCSFEYYIQCVQKSIVTDFHKRQNNFVKEKMKIVPSVLNLCNLKTPTALIISLSFGTKTVPHGQLCDYDYFTVLDQDLRNEITR